jgi:hypothetical protein
MKVFTHHRTLIWSLCASLMLLMGCATEDCHSMECSDLTKDSSLSTNGKSFTRCYLSDSPIETTLEDDSGKKFFDCTDSTQMTCLKPVVDAEFDYCDVH